VVVLAFLSHAIVSIYGQFAHVHESYNRFGRNKSTRMDLLDARWRILHEAGAHWVQQRFPCHG
jgi:hypothetical protein